MSLTDSQKNTVSDWIASGNSIAEVQRLLQEEFSISMTYMDVRFLIDDLDVAIVEPEPKDAEKKTDEPEIIEAGADNAVTVDVDAITRPGTLVSGNVTFSDGVTMGWQLLSNGQLGLTPGDNPDYRPSPADMEEFRVQLDETLRKKGF